MKRFTVTGTFWLLLGCFLSVNTGAQTELTIATEQWPPYVYEAHGKIVGYSIDILDKVFAEMGVKTTMTQYPWARATKLTFSGQADALFHASKHEERMKYCYYPDEPLTDSQYVLFIRKADIGKLVFDSYDDLLGYRVGVTLGYSYTQEFLDFLHAYNLHQETFSDESNFKMLASDRIDYFPSDLRNGVFWVRQLGFQDQLTYLEKPVFQKDYYLIFNKENVSKAFVQQFSETLKQFKQTKQFRNIEEKFLK